MENGRHDFCYDGTIEGLLCVYIRCISMKVRPLSIKPDYMVIGTPYEDRYIFIRSDVKRADLLYKYVGECSSAEVQQMLLDCFLTSLPNKELDLFELVCRAIRYGARIAEDYEDPTMHRIQMAIRDLYRESQLLVSGLKFCVESDVSIAELNPRNCVLPLIKRKILSNPTYDDLLAYDKRHALLLLRHGAENEIIDIHKLSIPPVNGSKLLYETFWPYVLNGRSCTCNGLTKRKSDGLDSLWRIA
ncbi:MAG: hypothetical protein MJ094_07370 [Saccharofermentans sp.]|nr:hypothetical protein [Saccharofermentans sp.]